MDAKQLWQAALERIRQRISPGAYTTWFNDTAGVRIERSQLVVGVPNVFASEHLTQRFAEIARVAVSEVLGRSAQITFVVAPPAPAASASAVTPARASAGMGTQRSASRRTTTSGRATQPPTRSRSARTTSATPRRVQQAAATLDPPRAPAAGTRAGRGRASQRPEWVAQPALDGFSAFSRPSAVSSEQATKAEPPQHQEAPDEPQRAPTPVRRVTPALFDATSPHSLNPRHVFETFVVGTANRLAYAAAQVVADAPGEQYNPLLIYGDVGLGKTHLLHAIGHRSRQAGLSVAYVTAERFTNEIIEAIRQRTTDEFRRRYRAVDVLLVDDVEFIAGKDSTEEEFFHTFNALHEANKQIVLSSDRVPQAMRQLHDRLRSRFEWGLVADIHPPDFEQRLEILRVKAQAHPVPVSDDVLVQLARPECANIRTLEGTLTRVIAYAEMLGQPLDVRLLPLALGPLASEQTQSYAPLTGEDVLLVVAQHYGVSVEVLRSKSRKRQVSWARQVAMYILRHETDASLLQIGMQLGGRDHTTVMHGYTCVSTALAHDPQARAEIEAIQASLRR